MLRSFILILISLVCLAPMGDFNTEVQITDGVNGPVDTILDNNNDRRFLVQTIPDTTVEQPVTLPPELFDPFNRLRVSNPTTLFDQHFRADKHPIYWDEKLTGSATTTHQSNYASVELDVTSTLGDRAIRATYQYFPYFPGKGTTVVLTGNFKGLDGNRKMYGYFDELDGFYFKAENNVFYVCLRSSTSGSAVDTCTAQSNWNTDKLDGTGASGLTLDLTKQQIFLVDFQWLGSGRVRWGFNLEGQTVFTHIVDHANTSLDKPYNRQGDLPLRIEIENIDGVTASDMHHTCSTVISDGGTPDTGKVYSYDSGTNDISFRSEKAVIALRLKSDQNRGSFHPTVKDLVMSTGNAAALWRIYWNPTVTATWTSVNNDSTVEAAYGNNITSWSGGTMVLSGYTPKRGQNLGSLGRGVDSNISYSRDIDGNSTVFLITTEMVSGTGKVLGAMTWREYQ